MSIVWSMTSKILDTYLIHRVPNMGLLYHIGYMGHIYSGSVLTEAIILFSDDGTTYRGSHSRQAAPGRKGRHHYQTWQSLYHYWRQSIIWRYTVSRLPWQAGQGHQVQCHLLWLVSRLLSPHRSYQGMQASLVYPFKNAPEKIRTVTQIAIHGRNVRMAHCDSDHPMPMRSACGNGVNTVD